MLVYSHPLGGYLELSTAGDLMVLHCHWPLDLQDDEWGDIQNCYPGSDYLGAVNDAMKIGKGRVKGVNDGFLAIEKLDDGFAIEFSGSQAGCLSSSLWLHVREPIGILLRASGDVYSQFAAQVG